MFTKAVLLGSSMYMFGWRKVLLVTGGAGGLSWFTYEKHMYNKELYDRLNYIIINKVPLSGVRIQRRGAFPSWGFVTWLIPFYHESLQFTDPTTGAVLRQVGLGRSPDAKGLFNFTSEFVSHLSTEYQWLNRFEQSFPIEAWVDYKRATGNYPTDVDGSVLTEITRTREEPPSPLPFYKTIYLKPIIDIDGRWTLSSCQTAVWYAIRKEELLRKEKQRK